MQDANSNREVEAYLARIRKTIADSNRMVEQAELRLAETDRLLESQGVTREQVMAMHFTEEQREMANRELERRGLEPLADEEPAGADVYAAAAAPHGLAGMRPAGAEREVEERQKKFGMMMKPFMI